MQVPDISGSISYGRAVATASSLATTSFMLIDSISTGFTAL